MPFRRKEKQCVTGILQKLLSEKLFFFLIKLTISYRNITFFLTHFIQKMHSRVHSYQVLVYVGLL